MTSISRRTFFVQSGMAAAAAVLPPSARASDPTDLRARLAHDPLRPQYHLMPGSELRIDNTRAAVTTPKTDALHLRPLVDAPVLEIFAHRTTAITERIYTAPQGTLRISMPDVSALRSLDLWPVKPISKDRLTKL